MSGSGRGLSNNKYPGLTKLGLILIVPGYLQRSTDRAPEPGDLALLAAALRRCQSTGDLDLELDTAEPGAGLHTDNGDRGPAGCAAADPWRLRGSVAGVRAAAGYNIPYSVSVFRRVRRRARHRGRGWRDPPATCQVQRR